MTNNHATVDAHALRRRNLKALVREAEGPTNFAKRLGYAGPSYISQMVSGHRRISERTSRAFETSLGLPPGWLDQDHAKPEQPPPADTTLISLVVASVCNSMNDAGIRPPPNKFAEVVAMVYEDATSSGEVDQQLVQRIIKLLK